MSYIVLRVLNETRPMWFYLLAALLFVLGQLAWFLLGRVLCTVSNFSIFELRYPCYHMRMGDARSLLFYASGRKELRCELCPT
jgi:LSD1 subclass zinc finger protein